MFIFANQGLRYVLLIYMSRTDRNPWLAKMTSVRIVNFFILVLYITLIIKIKLIYWLHAFYILHSYTCRLFFTCTVQVVRFHEKSQ